MRRERQERRRVRQGEAEHGRRRPTSKREGQEPRRVRQGETEHGRRGPTSRREGQERVWQHDSDQAEWADRGDFKKEAALTALGLQEGATTDEIRAAYRQMVRVHHPDRALESEKEAATIKTAEINDAYAYLISGTA